MYKTLSIYPVINGEGSLYYLEEDSLETLKDKLMPWLNIENKSSDNKEEDLNARAEEYMRRFVIPKREDLNG